MTTNPIARLRALDACAPALEWAAGYRTLRAAWEECGARSWLTWVIGAAHSKGTLPRTRLVACALRWVEPVAHLLPDESVLDLGVVAQWTIGVATLDEVRAALQRLRDHRSAYADAAAYAAAYAADAYADAYAAYAASAAYAAAAAAADAAAYAAADAADAAADADADAAAADADADADAFCDVIRASITCDEVCAALGLDPDAPLAEKEAA